MKKLISVLVAAALLALCLAGCGAGSDRKTITVGASSTPHAEILEQVKATLAEQGYDLQIKVYDDYVMPNTATEDGELDANYFQHQPYLTEFNEENGTHLVSIAAIHYEPYGIYAGTAASLDKLKEGDKIAVPNDATNEARALQLLAANGLIELDPDAGLEATVKSITANPKNFDIVEMEAALITTVMDEFGVAVVNGNYAIEAGLRVSEALAVEDKDSEAANTFANILVVKEGNEENEGLKALAAALQTEAVRTYIENTYDGAVVAKF